MSGTGAFSEIEAARLRGGLGIACNLGFFCGGFGDLGMVRERSESEDEVVIDTLSCREQQQAQQHQRKLIVGYALTSKKKKSFLQPKLEVLSRKIGIFFVAIDQKRPLSEQGPFDIILHKLSGKEWQEEIEDYQQKHPEVTILDPPGAIQRINNRQSMLQDVADLNLSDSCGKICVPKQMVVLKDATSSAECVAEAGLKFPLVAKPLWIDGTAKSHQLFLAYDRLSLLDLEPPLVLQEFVNHGGVLFKVFVVGEIIKVVRRCSLPNVSNCEKAKVAGVFQLPRVSSASASPDHANMDPGVVELPPRYMLERLVKELRTRLGLRLFNIDMIREYGSRDIFYVIDINYFPGYGKMPEYEQVFMEFFSSLAQAKLKRYCK